MKTFVRAAGPCALAVSMIFGLLGAAPDTSDTATQAAAIADVHESYNLLSKSYYKPVDQQTLFSGARTALIAAAKTHGVKVAVPEFTARSADSNLQSLDEAILATASQAHGNATDYAYAAIVGMAGSVHDKYTQFMTPDEYKQFNNALDPQHISGIGVLIEQDPDNKLVRVNYVVPETPADRAGIKSGDEFVTIEGKSTKNMSRDDASSLLRGSAGSVVHLQVASAQQSNAHDVSITRSEISPPTVVFHMLPNQIGYVYVLAFGKATPSEFDLAVDRLKADGARAYVLDLRNDGGGYVDSALQILSRFIANRPLLTVEERSSPSETIQADNDVTIKDAPVTVLVNGYTASASEITAGALQDDGIASLVGTKTFGKGVMQTLTQLPGGAAIKITTAHYLTPSRRDLNLKGIEPDVNVAANRNDLLGVVDKDAQLRAAIELIQKKIAQVKP